MAKDSGGSAEEIACHQLPWRSGSVHSHFTILQEQWGSGDRHQKDTLKSEKHYSNIKEIKSLLRLPRVLYQSGLFDEPAFHHQHLQIKTSSNLTSYYPFSYRANILNSTVTYSICTCGGVKLNVALIPTSDSNLENSWIAGECHILDCLYSRDACPSST